ncbi:MAG: glycosyltransferase family 4 protein [Candidatus Thorarchaeota archaeon]
MKILHLCDSLNPAGLGGYESYLHYLSAELSQKGHRSYIVTQAPERDSPASIELPNYDVLYLSGNYLEARKWEFFSIPEEERDASVEKLFCVNDLEDNVSKLIGQLGLLIREIEPDIIHAHSIYVVFNKVLEIIKNDGLIDKIPLLLTVHGLPKPLILPSGKETTDYAELVTTCPFDQIFGVSEFVCDTLREYLPEEKQDLVERLYLGINMDVFRPYTNVRKEWDVAFMGRMELMKSVDLFPEMLSILSKDFPELRFLMTGEGSLKEQIFSEFEERNVSHLVDYRGVVETAKVPELINKSRVFIYPSRREPFGLSIVEAMACGVPVVTANVFGPAEIVDNGYDGVAIVPGEVIKLANAITNLLADKEFRGRISKNCRESVLDRFDIKKHAEILEEIYRNMEIN